MGHPVGRMGPNCCYTGGTLFLEETSDDEIMDQFESKQFLEKRDTHASNLKGAVAFDLLVKMRI